MDNKEQMHPEDRRNLILFIIAAIVIWYGFDTYLIKPRVAKMRQAQEQALSEAAVPDHAGAIDTDGTGDGDIRDRAAVLAETSRVRIDNDKVTGSIALRGGRFDDLSLDNYYKTLEKDEHVFALTPQGAAHSKYVEFGWLPVDEGIQTPGKGTLWTLEEGSVLKPNHPVTLRWNNGQGLVFRRHIALDENYMFKVRQSVTNKGTEQVTLHPYALTAQYNLPQDFTGRAIVHEGPLAYLDGELVEKPYKKMLKKEPEAEIKASDGWIGISEKYWFTSLVPQDHDPKTFRFIATKPETEKGRPKFQVDVVGSARKIAPGETVENATYLFSGAKELRLLQDYEETIPVKHFDLAVDFGLYYFLTKPFFLILDFFGRLTGNMGVALIILTVIVRGAVFPLANTSFRSFAKMKQISPQMAEIREKYGDDKKKLQQELVKLYEKENVNPMAGCFPILLQIPIFFALYKTVLVTIEMRHAPFFGWIQDLSAPDPLTIFNLFGLIDWDPPRALMIGPWACLMFLAMLAQRRMNPPAQDPTQAMMSLYMPFVMTYILAKFASGLVIYWAVSNTLSIVQQYIIMRSMGVEVYLFRRSKEDKEMEEMVKEGPSVHPELEVLEHDVEDALFGDEDEAGAGNDDKPISPPKPRKSKKKKK